MTRLMVGLGLAILASTLPGRAATPQSSCQPPAPPVSRQSNIFSDIQESDLGDAIAERSAPDIRVIDNDDLAAELRRIGDRLVRHLPPTQLNIRFSLVDQPDPNAFVLPGGRVYVARKLISLTQDEDELAGVLGHELGHLVARQQTQRFTRLLHDAIGVTAVGDRQDIFDKYNRLLDSVARDPRALATPEDREDAEQRQADELGLFVVAAAGYDPQAHARFWDRYAGTNGKTGGFFSNLFGTTPSASKRLRQMIKNAASLPASCVESRSSADRDAYQRWQAAVIGYSGPVRTEHLHNVVSRVTLALPLGGGVEYARFSPDGRFVVAQHDGGITVFARDPFTPVLHIDTPDAGAPQFSPDSSSVVFQTRSLRVERWSIAGKKLVDAHELAVRGGCIQTRLSSDGKTLACMDGTFGVSLVDVASSAASRTQRLCEDDFSTGWLSPLFGRGGTKAAAGIALDTHDRVFVAATESGELALYNASDRAVIATATLPAGRLSPLDTVTVSPDLKWLTVSAGGRGGSWDLTTGARTAGGAPAIAASTSVADADWTAVEDRSNRVLVYPQHSALSTERSTGELHGHVFGSRPAISPAAGLLAVSNGDGRVVLYDLATMERRDDFTFAHSVSFTRFSEDGTRLFVLTDDQTAWVLDTHLKKY